MGKCENRLIYASFSHFFYACESFTHANKNDDAYSLTLFCMIGYEVDTIEPCQNHTRAKSNYNTSQSLLVFLLVANLHPPLFPKSSKGLTLLDIYFFIFT